MTEVRRTRTVDRNNSKNMKKYKLVVLGNQNVGKTTLTYKLCEDEFLNNVEATIGVDLRTYVMNIDGEDVKVMIQLEIWDTAGQERFRKTLIRAYYRNADAVVFVYDVTNQQSFNDLRIWIEECARNELGNIPKILVANKCDLPAAVDRNLAQCFADANGMLLFETSSQPNSECDHVRAIFYTVAQKLKTQKPLSTESSVLTHSMLQDATVTSPSSSSCSC